MIKSLLSKAFEAHALRTASRETAISVTQSINSMHGERNVLSFLKPEYDMAIFAIIKCDIIKSNIKRKPQMQRSIGAYVVSTSRAADLHTNHPFI